MYTIYSKTVCPYCDQAKALLKSKGLEYTELTLNLGQPLDTNKQYATMAELHTKVPGARTVPQIFDGDKYIGGFNELKEHLSKS